MSLKLIVTQYLKLKMPKSIIDEIGNVTYSVVSQNQSLQKIIPFSLVDLDSKYNEITMPLKFDFTDIRITINSNDSNNCSEESGFSGTDLSECQILEGEIEQEQDNENSQEENQDSVPDPDSTSNTNIVVNDENGGSDENGGIG